MTLLPGSECVPVTWWECRACGRRLHQHLRESPGALGVQIGLHWLIDHHGQSIQGRYVGLDWRLIRLRHHAVERVARKPVAGSEASTPPAGELAPVLHEMRV
jgi:hypothetical protein